jgi:VWFA-related protein
MGLQAANAQSGEQEPTQAAPTFRTQSNIVLVPTLVRGDTGHAVYGLQAQDFIVEDNGVAQAIHLDDESEPQPLSLVVAIQTGRSANREFSRIRGLNSMLGPILEEPQTEIAIVEFDSQPKLAVDFTADSQAIERALHSVQSGDGGAAILDTLNFCAGILNKLPEGRQRVLLLISETRDHGSKWTKVDDVVSLIGDSNITVYSLAFSPGLGDLIDPYRDKGPQPGMDPTAPIFLAIAGMKRNAAKAVAFQTGGEFEMFDTQNGFENHMLDFTNHLHSRYLLSFQPRDPTPGLHRITVMLADPQHASVLARGSYWARGSGTAPTEPDQIPPIEGTWQSKINPVTGKPSVTLHISASEGVAGGTIVLVNPDGGDLTSAILNPSSLAEKALTFTTTFQNGKTFSWHFQLARDGEKARLHGNVGPVVIDEVVFRQP